MKIVLKVTTLALIGISSCLFSSCVVPTDGNGNPAYDPAGYAPANNYAADQQAAYRAGYSQGRTDGQAGRSSNPAAYTSSYNIVGKVKFIEGYNKGYTNYSRDNVHGNHPQGYGRMTATVGQGQVQVMQDGRVVSTLRTASPNVEEHHFTSGQSQMVVKSRGNHGPATVELFDTRTGILRDKVLAFAIRNGQPSWARGMQD